MGLNEGMKGALLKEVCSQIAPVYSVKFHRHPETGTFLGAATIAFTSSGDGRKAANELDGRIIGGCYLRAELDDGGKGEGEGEGERRYGVKKREEKRERA